MLPGYQHLMLVFAVVLLLPIITVCFSPPPITYAAGKLVKSTIWIFGGLLSDDESVSSAFSKMLWSLDVSQPFSLSSPPWTDHSSDGANQQFVFAREHLTMEIGPNDSTLWVYGGKNSGEDISKYSQVISYDINAKSWSIPSIQGSPLVLKGAAVTRSNDGILYYFGGAILSFSDTTAFTRIDTVESLNTATGEYKIISANPSNLPGRYGHTATMVGTKIYIIGGGTATSPSNLNTAVINVINVFDTTNNVWTSHTATGETTPRNRYHHTAALTSDSQRIVIFGGRISSTTQLNDVWIFNVNDFTWTLGVTTGTLPVNLAEANAFIVGNQMLVMLGRTKSNSKSLKQNTIYVLDMSTNPWTWVENFTPPTVASNAATSAAVTSTSGTSTSIPPEGSSGLNTAVVIGIAFGGVAFLLFAGSLGWFCFVKRNCGIRRNQKYPNGPPPSEPYILPVLHKEVQRNTAELSNVLPVEMDSSANLVLPSYPPEVALRNSDEGGGKYTKER